ncbi:MAG: metallophosphoesterase [Pirellulaceae bacterium]|nr:metallophosphoesterase [Pirellulaceae bacterium]
MQRHGITRRRFVNLTALGAASTLLPISALADEDASEPLRFGVIADVHKDVMHDADQRLRLFVEEMKREKVDFIIQLGDFCVPIDANLPFLKIWNSFSGPRYHVLGNHDTDGAGDHPDRFKRSETVEYWGMEDRYYSFDKQGIHFVVLDGNDQGPGQQPYYRWVAEDQLKWLTADLENTQLPTIVFVHQSPERPEDGGLENGKQVQEILEQANQNQARKKVVACLSGHHHRDYLRQINGILYSQINSASYYWLGGNYLKVRYSPEIDKAYPYIKYTVPYQDPLFAVVTLDRAHGFLQIEGRRTEFVGPSPWELGASREELDAATLMPRISNWKTPVGMI